MMEPRRTSSVYSDTFELDDLLLRLTKQADEQHDMVIDLLRQENNALYRKLKAERQLWRVIVGLVHEIVELTGQLEKLLGKARLRMQQGRIKYLANCTAF
ncbi:hypothetical protein CORC01_14380 [Colletotrichum orchidophilum]|uniref:Uncharacterized protein n=1 Tax=Colletotrichum orchidophilum TaxID=1209926 RepID=A0A1G4AMC0_9PEZI|nr:uncharacterized protein CORC01_14380 [Colletotrichum orchidophilum]OHE90319.1 hypothetical protein CORC01_14380 [Colletotrichum orchidophilum]